MLWWSANRNISLSTKPNTCIKGKITGKGDVKIDGNVEGDIDIKGTVIIGKHGNIKGNIISDNVEIHGRIEGNITARNNLRLFSTAQLYGDASMKDFKSATGAVFVGNCIILKDKDELESMAEKASAGAAGISGATGYEEVTGQEEAASHGKMAGQEEAAGHETTTRYEEATGHGGVTGHEEAIGSEEVTRAKEATTPEETTSYGESMETGKDIPKEKDLGDLAINVSEPGSSVKEDKDSAREKELEDSKTPVYTKEIEMETASAPASEPGKKESGEDTTSVNRKKFIIKKYN
ncbi:MAG: polymer-forming cytoskeletal protein [Clostridiaceae bacterium]|nr:polymer-forming cytoskeletal protein [Clostridiaceae bacterium]